MPERSTVSQVTQIGLEATPGTAATATRRLASLSLTPSITVESEPFRPQGMKFATLNVLNREWAEVSGESSAPTYEEVIVPLSGAANTAVVSQVMDASTPTTAYEWLFNMDSFAADNPKTFTMETGQPGVQAERFTHVLFGSFGLEVSRSGVSLSTSAIAKAAQTAVAMASGLGTPATLTPMMPGHFSVYMADTHAGLSVSGKSDTTKRLGRIISASPSIEDRYNPAWFVNSAEDSFTTFVESPDGVGGTTGLTTEADANGMAHLATMRTGATKFLRLEALGPVIYNAGTQTDLRYMFRWDMAVKVASPDAYGDEDGIYAIPWTLQPVHDATWGRAQQITVRNKVATL